MPVPPKTEAGRLLRLPPGQGYLRVLLDGEIHPHRRAGSLQAEALPAVVHVIQDRLTLDARNRARLTEAIEAALRFGKGTAQRSSLELRCPESERDSRLLHRLALRGLRPRPPPAHPRPLQLQQPLGACPKCRGFGRTIGIDSNKRDPRPVALASREGLVKAFQGETYRRVPAATSIALRQDARHRHRSAPSRICRRPTRNGSSTASRQRSARKPTNNGEWYGVKGFFDWLESKAYKMHVRVFLSRYRAYTDCPDCRGGRLQPEAL